jgi:Septum formation
VERTCISCGRDPGTGSFCQHCGTRQPESVPEQPAATPQPPAPPPQQPEPAVPAPTQSPTAVTPPNIVQGAQPKRSGCRTGCLVLAGIAFVLVVVGGYLGWRFFNDEVLPGVQETADQFNAASETPPGPCYDLETDGELLTGWTEVSCSGPRQVEVSFAALFDDGPFPGDEYMTNTAASTCLAAFERYVGTSPDASAYGVDWLLPTEEMWANGTRQGICLVVADDGSSLEGVVKGSET